MQRPRGKAVQRAPAHQRFLAPVRHPDLRRTKLSDRIGELVPIAMVRQDNGEFDAALTRALADSHPAGREAGDRIREPPRPAVDKSGGWADDNGAGKILYAARFDGRGCQRSKIDALRLVVVTKFGQSAVNINGPVIPCIAEHSNDALRFAKRIGADEVGAFGKLFDRFQQLGNLLAAIGMAEYRQREGRFGDEDIAGNGLKTKTGRIGAALVVAGGDNAHAILLDGDLCRTQHVAGRMKADDDAIDLDRIAKCGSLRFAGEMRAIAQAHNVERLLRRHHLLMAGACMVRMTVSDECAIYGAHRIDIEIAGGRIEAGRCRAQKSFRTFQQDDPLVYPLTKIGRISLHAILTNKALAHSINTTTFAAVSTGKVPLADIGTPLLPPPFLNWFQAKGWSPRVHQLDLLQEAQQGNSTLLIAPTGAGKTLAGFLPALVDLASRGKSNTTSRGVHTLYISPLKALAVDIRRNLERPIEEMGLDISLETRTGDTPAYKRQRQKLAPPDILLTTPEQLALLISAKDAGRFFEDLRYVIFDELHSLVTSKRGHLLSLGLARLRRLQPGVQTIGLSATVAEPEALRRWLLPQSGNLAMASLVTVEGGAKPHITILETDDHVPWAGHSAVYALPGIYDAIKRHGTTLIFVNTRSQAERLFHDLWMANDDNLPIALHHGSLDVSKRRKVEQAMAANALRAVVATSTLDLGIDWGDVDLVIHVGAPKGASRLAQRIGRSNHRMDEPSRAILVPANRFEVMECQAALDANYVGAQDTPPLGDGSLDVLAQHVLGMACAEPFHADDLYAEVSTALPYAALPRDTFDRIVDFVATGGYALKSYERFAKIRQTADGTWRVTHPRFAQQYRLNVGTIIEAPSLNVRLTRQRGKGANARAIIKGGGPVLGKVEEYFVEGLSPGDTFFFSGRVLRFEGIRENECIVSNAEGFDAKIPAYAGGKFPLTTYLADQVRSMLGDPKRWGALPDQVSDWLRIQRDRSVLPQPGSLLVETFPRGERSYMVTYPFEGRLAHQTLGMLLTRRLERAKARPLGFIATDYALTIWGLRDMGRMFKNNELPLAELFNEDMLGDDLEAWLAESWMLKRTFRNCALISGLVEKRHPGQEKSGRQVTVSTDLIYDVLREHEPDHILIQATRADAATGLLDIRRLADMLSRIKGHIVHKDLDRISPLAVPVMMEIGKERVPGEAHERLLEEIADELTREMMDHR